MFFFTAYSFQCYQCSPKKADTNYTTEQCEMDQIKVDCSQNKTCIKFYKEEEHGAGENIAYRGCVSQSVCDAQKASCADEKKKKEDGTTLCLVDCCASVGDPPCNGTPKNSKNSAYTPNINKKTISMVIVAMVTVLCC